VHKHVARLGLKVMFEPGRMIAGNAGILVSQVIYVKEGEAKNFLIVDAAMNDLIRPTLYEAFHDIRPVVQPPADAPRMKVDVVGQVCETGDYLGLDRDLPVLKAGDLIAVGTAGAYGAVQARTTTTPACWCRKCWWTAVASPWCGRAAPRGTDRPGPAARLALTSRLFGNPPRLCRVCCMLCRWGRARLARPRTNRAD